LQAVVYGELNKGTWHQTVQDCHSSKTGTFLHGLTKLNKSRDLSLRLKPSRWLV
jgi:hypothetical protein